MREELKHDRDGKEIRVFFLETAKHTKKLIKLMIRYYKNYVSALGILATILLINVYDNFLYYILFFSFIYVHKANKTYSRFGL
jgi:hypothetical protein